MAGNSSRAKKHVAFIDYLAKSEERISSIRGTSYRYMNGEK